MPLITGMITNDGAAIDLIIEPPSVASHIPGATAITLRGAIDTGSALTGISKRLLQQLPLGIVDSILVGTPIGPPRPADRFLVKLSFVAGGVTSDFAELPVIATDCFRAGEEIQALIGRDVLNHCTFQYWGTAKAFQFAY